MEVAAGIALVIFGLFLLLACLLVDYANETESREQQAAKQRARKLELEQQAWSKHVQQEHQAMLDRGELQHPIPDISRFGQPPATRPLIESSHNAPRLADSLRTIYVTDYQKQLPASGQPQLPEPRD